LAIVLSHVIFCGMYLLPFSLENSKIRRYFILTSAKMCERTRIRRTGFLGPRSLQQRKEHRQRRVCQITLDIGMNPSPSLAWPAAPRNEGHACVVNIVMHALSVYHLPRACLAFRSLEGRKRVYQRQLTRRAHRVRIRRKLSTNCFPSCWYIAPHLESYVHFNDPISKSLDPDFCKSYMYT